MMAEIKSKKQAVYTEDVWHALQEYSWSFGNIVKFVSTLPTADVELVWHARWEANKSGYLACTNCAWERRWIPLVDHYPHCPNCGARMDGGADNGK